MLPDFDPTVTEFTLENAYVLMRACQAAKAPDEEKFSGRLKELGFKQGDRKWYSSQFDAGYLAWTSTFAVLVFRGTDNAGGWATNLYFDDFVDDPYYAGKVHPGFSAALDALWNPLFADLSGPQSGLPLFIAGHSRGGAIATLAAKALKKEGIAPAAVYTFGAPRVGNATFANHYGIDEHYRVENDRDIVPHLPPPPFRHVGERYWLDQDGKLTDPTGETPTGPVLQAALLAALTGPGAFGRTGAALLGGIASQGGLLASEFFSDHANTEYAYWLWDQLPEPARTAAANTPYA